MDLHSSVEQLKNGRPADVTYPDDLREGVRDAIHSWKVFCTLPEIQKKKFVYFEENGKLDLSGYEIKKQPGVTLDLKENFHVTLKEIERLNQIKHEVQFPLATKFIDDAERLMQLAEPTIREFAMALGEAFALPNIASEVLAGKQSWIFRYIHYFGGRDIGSQIATPHADKSGFTLHLFESDEGLEYMDWEKDWYNMPVRRGETVIIPGMQLQLASKGKLKALCHRVVARERFAAEGRYSAVCFVPLIYTPAWNKDGEGRTQDFVPGFNYDLAYPKFKALFVAN
jgi:isopenicillin N synthase-like dioxygenase